ncbi:MAG TPA: 2-hydroxyacid dehydrogenase [Rhizomicrobium sp.]|jgi:phosphoglycerate dehydrogenase-like enzyme|nr:2-hydroxyacid dehydrogenase [Rhizomicrobium sp.]
MSVKVYFTAHGDEELYRAFRGIMPDGFELVTLTTNSEDEQLTKIADCEVALVAIMNFSAKLIDAAPRLRLAIHLGVGYQDTVDVAALKRRGIRLALTPEGTVTAVAEHTVMMMLAIYKELLGKDRDLRNGLFRWHDSHPTTRNLNGRVIGYVGMGRIGQQVARRLVPFGTTGIYVDPAAPLTEAQEAALNLRRAGFAEVLSSADIVTVHVPLTNETRHIMDAAAIAKMRPGAVLINTARGGVLDEKALQQALESGHLSGAGIDVFETEPVPPGYPLARFENVVFSPHAAGGTGDALHEKIAVIANNLECYRRGKMLTNEVTL